LQVLQDHQIKQKIKRLSYEILENNLEEQAVILAGINNNGYQFASLLLESLSQISDKKFKLARITLSPADPLGHEISINLSKEELQDQCVILVDDVANTGRTIFYAFRVLMNILVKKVQVAVLVDRKHKLFPISVDYLGLSLATTFQENIKASLTGSTFSVDLH
jgi:pyrimidine operon attenuation protein/uracil phosphoribosyltransferase